MSANIAEMDVENLISRTEVPDHIKNFLARPLEHFRNRALAEIQAMIRTLLNRDESLQAIHRTENAINSLIPFGWHAGILRVARHANLVFVRHRNHAIQEVCDALPKHVRVDRSEE